ncbi:MAG: 1-acyl-sn-glycerol-3-phosphate acyltransferase [Prevotella sp.]|nr:1-acyl-sn-glycerol-3-phosphate acyltransferase [Prevotella sp.]
MAKLLNFAYKIYQVIVLIPVVVLASAWAGTTMAVMCPLTGRLKAYLPFSLGVMTRSDWWGSLASRWWAKIIMRASLLPVKVEKSTSLTSHLSPLTSCIYVANHQGAYDIFLICGYLGAEIRWMLKKELEKIPFLGIGCRHAGYIYVDKSSRAAVRDTYRQAEKALENGASLMVFPEGARTRTGKMMPFTRGAFTLADELQLPVVPLTINGSFHVLPRHRDGKFITWHPLRLTIHEPIYPLSKGQENIERLRKLSYEAIASTLE